MKSAPGIMMTSSNGSIFRVTSLFTGHLLILITKAIDAELWCFLWSAPEPTIEQTMETPVIWDAIVLIMTSLYCIMMVSFVFVFENKIFPISYMKLNIIGLQEVIYDKFCIWNIRINLKKQANKIEIHRVCSKSVSFMIKIFLYEIFVEPYSLFHSFITIYLFSLHRSSVWKSVINFFDFILFGVALVKENRSVLEFPWRFQDFSVYYPELTAVSKGNIFWICSLPFVCRRPLIWFNWK